MPELKKTSWYGYSNEETHMGQVKPKGPDEMINCQKKTPFLSCRHAMSLRLR